MSTSKKAQPYSSQLKGVAALLGEEISSSTSTPQSIPLTSIRLPKQQPRRYFDPEKLEQLIASVKEHGILEPLLVRPVEAGNYELVAGERRFRAAKTVGLTEVPVVIKELTEQDAFQLALVENLQREDLNPVEETEGILHLIALQLRLTLEEVIQLLYRMHNEAKGKVTRNVLGSSEATKIREIFDGIGSISWESFVSSRLPLLKLPDEVLEALHKGQIAYTKAQAIARIKDPDLRKAILEEALTQDLSLMQIRDRIKEVHPVSSDEPPSLKQRVQEVSQRVQKMKLWEDPKKQKRLEKLIAQMESLLGED